MGDLMGLKRLNVVMANVVVRSAHLLRWLKNGY